MRKANNPYDKQIALFIPSLRGGGAERVALNLANCLVEFGHQVDLVLVKAEGQYMSRVSDKVNIIDLDSTGVLNSLPKLIMYFKKYKPASVISFMNHVNIITFFAIKMARVKTKLVVTEHNTLSTTFNNSKGLRARCLPILMRLTYRSADAIIAVSHGVADDLARSLKISRKKIDVIYNPILNDTFTAQMKEENNHPWINSDIPVILSVGRLTQQKDFETLIYSFSKVRRKIGAKLIILGEGELRKPLEQLVEQLGLTNDVDMPGFVNNPYCYMSRADVFVLSSRWEGLGNVLVEALACGTKVISTDCPSGPKEILSDGRYGTLVPVGDVVRLSKAILDAIEKEKSFDKDLSTHLELFKEENVSKEYLSILI